MADSILLTLSLSLSLRSPSANERKSAQTYNLPPSKREVNLNFNSAAAVMTLLKVPRLTTTATTGAVTVEVPVLLIMSSGINIQGVIRL